MAATGNEVTTLKQFKNAVAKKSASPATETSYGTVKLISDEDFETYVNSTSGDSTVTGQEVFTLSQLKSVLSDINSGGGSDSGNVTLWEGTATIQDYSTIYLNLSDNPSNYSRIEITTSHTSGSDTTIEYFDPSVGDSGDTYPDGIFSYLYDTDFIALHNKSSAYRLVTKITGIK